MIKKSTISRGRIGIIGAVPKRDVGNRGISPDGPPDVSGPLFGNLAGASSKTIFDKNVPNLTKYPIS